MDRKMFKISCECFGQENIHLSRNRWKIIKFCYHSLQTAVEIIYKQLVCERPGKLTTNFRQIT